jgi:hypothetical protein
VQPVALQYRVGGSGPFAAAPGGFVGDATTGPGEATLVTPVSAVLPADAGNRPLVQLRILTTNAVGQDEWVGVDDIEVEASGMVCGSPDPRPPGTPPTQRPPEDPPAPPAPPSRTIPADPPRRSLSLTGLALSPAGFKAAKRGPAVMRTGRTGTSLRFRLSRPATVVFRVTGRATGRFSIRGRRGLNRLRFTGRVRGRALSPGSYRLTAQAIDRTGLVSTTVAVPFRVRPQ